MHSLTMHSLPVWAMQCFNESGGFTLMQQIPDMSKDGVQSSRERSPEHNEHNKWSS